MSKLIRQLLNESDPLFSIGLTRLEFAAGKPGIDARLTAEIVSLTREKISALGLDPLDTTGAELYSALCQKAIIADEALRAYLGHPANIDSGALAITRLANEIIGNRDTWVVKHTVLRGLLKQNPPKKVMKAFHFQSVDSMAKRMDPGEMLLAARIIESKTWWTKTKKIYEDFSAKDFEKANLRLIYLNDPRWLPILQEYCLQTGHMVVGSKECGLVGFMPNTSDAGYITTVTRALHALNETYLHGIFLKLHFVNPSLGTILVHAIDEGDLVHTSVSGSTFHWRDVQRYFGTKTQEYDIGFAHLDANDLGWVQIETQLSLLVPELSYWIGLDFCGVSYGEGRVISCNLLDVALSTSRGLTHSHMHSEKLQRSLRGELMARYLNVPIARALALKQFDISVINEENW